jgi:RHS repeat-associated protein
VVRFLDGNVDGDLLDTQDNTDSTLYYTYDGNFNVTAVIKPDGTVAERYTYDPYGKVTFKAADWSDAANQAKSAYDNEVLYCGYRYDPESGNYLARRRYLTPPLGRWLTPDPIVHGDGMNMYQYVGSRPASRLDPTGLIELEVDRSRSYPEGAAWKKAEGESYIVEAQAKVGQKACCVKIPFRYTFEWRHYQIWEITSYRRTGEAVVSAGEVIAAVGGVAIAVGLADDLSVVGIIDDPIMLPGGTTIAVVGGVLTVVGYLQEGVDALFYAIPPTVNVLIGDYWEWQNLTWQYGPADLNQMFPCTGKEILGPIDADGKRSLLPGKTMPKQITPTGTAPGKSPE